VFIESIDVNVDIGSEYCAKQYIKCIIVSVRKNHARDLGT